MQTNYAPYTPIPADRMMWFRTGYNILHTSGFDWVDPVKSIKTSSFKSSENIPKKGDGSKCTVSNNKFFSETLNELAWKAREMIL